jgi:hypothetical protein
MTMSNSKGLVSTGYSLVRRHQRLVWWVFAVGFILAAMGSGAARLMFSKLTEHSLASQDIAGQFHVARFIELLMQPEVQMPVGMVASYVMQIVFLVYMIFVLGGILAVYREDRKLSKAEFFENCGLYFWRFVRLTLISFIPLGLVFALYGGVRAIGDKIAQASPLESREFWWRMFGGIVVLVLFLLVRLWFDVAQVRAQAQNERSMWKNTFRSWKIMWNSKGTLLWMYFRISLVAWVVLAAGIWIWLRIPGSMYPLSFLLLEVVMFVQIAVRLWLRASAVVWYEGYAKEHPAVVVEFTTPKPAEVVEGTATP